ncbi:MAG: adenylate/guanylate cyclase domain-containing protein [Bryobacteraceae bacterium]
MTVRSLLVQRRDGSSQVIPIDKPVLRIGRAADNDIVLNDEARSVSRWHANITTSPDSPVSLYDLRSANGVLINGRAVSGSAMLKANDLIDIGQFRIVYREESTSLPFSIKAGVVDLQQLQRSPNLLSFETAQDSPGESEVRRLELLYEVGMTLASAQLPDEVTTAAVNLLFKIEQVHRATLILWNEEAASFGDTTLRFRGGDRVHASVDPYDPRGLVMSRTILDKVRQDDRPLLLRDTKGEGPLSASASIVRAGIQAALCSPLNSQGRFLGILYADNLADPDAFSDSDFRTFTAIAAQAGLALGNAISSRELLRREVQREALKVYLPPQIADLILSSDGAMDLSGKLQEITVLFADIRGFTRMSERLDARELVQMLNELFTVLTEEIFKCNGTVDKFIGDAIMALFGAPLPSEHSADDALAAAIRMQQAATRLNAKRAEDGLEQMLLGIGLHTGPAVVGNIGSADRVQYTAIGDTVNVASRLVDLAGPHEIIVSERFRDALSHKDLLTLVGESKLKGRQDKVRVYGIDWANSSHHSLDEKTSAR